ncbi:MAG: YbhB/YbcL family Raf kinase inhibitor-like protein [Gemmatimonadaceae bacterium]
MSLILTSPAFANGGSIPGLYTCDGDDIAPALDWTGAPGGTKGYVLIVDDPDAPDPAAPKMTWVHWVLFDIPASVMSIAQGGATPAGARDGQGDSKPRGYGGPCPPIGRHRYYFRLYALDTLLGDLAGANKAVVVEKMQGHVLASAELMGTYQRAKR